MAAAGKAAVESGIKAATAEAKPSVTTKTKLVKVEQSYIDSLQEFRAACPPRPLCVDFSNPTVCDNEPMRRCWEQAAALLKMRQDKDDEILKQYEANGVAYWEVEIKDE